jgi:hypothetical protein
MRTDVETIQYKSASNSIIWHWFDQAVYQDVCCGNAQTVQCVVIHKNQVALALDACRCQKKGLEMKRPRCVTFEVVRSPWRWHCHWRFGAQQQTLPIFHLWHFSPISYWEYCERGLLSCHFRENPSPMLHKENFQLAKLTVPIQRLLLDGDYELTLRCSFADSEHATQLSKLGSECAVFLQTEQMQVVYGEFQFGLWRTSVEWTVPIKKGCNMLVFWLKVPDPFKTRPIRTTCSVNLSLCW